MLPTNSETRKRLPIGIVAREYFKDALAYVAYVSWHGNQKHNPGERLHWSRGKSGDHEDCVMRHLLESGTVDADGLLHSGHLAWRALAVLQLEIEERLAAGEDLYGEKVEDHEEDAVCRDSLCLAGVWLCDLCFLERTQRVREEGKM